MTKNSGAPTTWLTWLAWLQFKVSSCAARTLCSHSASHCEVFKSGHSFKQLYFEFVTAWKRFKHFDHVISELVSFSHGVMHWGSKEGLHRKQIHIALSFIIFISIPSSLLNCCTALEKKTPHPSPNQLNKLQEKNWRLPRAMHKLKQHAPGIRLWSDQLITSLPCSPFSAVPS